MDRPIVVGTDGSESASKAVAEAIRLARALEEPLHIVSAYRSRSMSAQGLPAEYAGTLGSLPKAESILAEAASRARAAGVTVSTIAFGTPDGTITLPSERTPVAVPADREGLIIFG